MKHARDPFARLALFAVAVRAAVVVEPLFAEQVQRLAAQTGSKSQSSSSKESFILPPVKPFPGPRSGRWS